VRLPPGPFANQTSLASKRRASSFALAVVNLNWVFILLSAVVPLALMDSMTAASGSTSSVVATPCPSTASAWPTKSSC
jgi:hypothetical protein